MLYKLGLEKAHNSAYTIHTPGLAEGRKQTHQNHARLEFVFFRQLFVFFHHPQLSHLALHMLLFFVPICYPQGFLLQS
jgi:hypothetical protein